MGRFEGNEWKSAIDVWFHDPEKNRFRKVETMPLENTWFRDDADKGDKFLLGTNDRIHFFEKDDMTGSFDWFESVDLPFPNLYSMSLDASVMENSILYVPSGIYGVDTLSLKNLPNSSIVDYRKLESTVSQWMELSPSFWERVNSTNTDEAGILTSMQWLYRPDSWPAIDPDATDMGDLWRQSSWFGYYSYSSTDPSVIRHLDHGPVLAPSGLPEDFAGVLLYDLDLGYFWTSKDCYPFMYVFQNKEWAYYLQGSGTEGNRWFYGLGSGWFSFSN
jgi:hypothetical protein